MLMLSYFLGDSRLNNSSVCFPTKTVFILHLKFSRNKQKRAISVNDHVNEQ